MKIKLKQKSSWPIVAIDQNHLQSCLNKYGRSHSKWIVDWRRRTEGGNEKEILDYLERDFSQYAWNFRTLDRRLQAFGIYYTDKRVSLEEVQDAVWKELDGPGKLLGYRAMQNRLRQEHDLLVPRDLVHAVMFDLDEEGLTARCPIRKKGKPKGHFTTRGVNLRGLDYLSQFQHLCNGNTFWRHKLMHNRFLRTWLGTENALRLTSV